MQNTGQACTAAKRLIVTEDLYEDFVAGLQQSFATFTPGDPADPSTTLAPLSSARAAKDLHAQIQDAIDKGGTVVTGGTRPDLPGAFVEATILTDVTPEMRAYKEELFGPAAVVYKVRDEEEAVELANDSDYGLGAAVFSGDLDRARSVADRLGAGVGWVNTHPPPSPPPLLPRPALRRREALRLRPRALRAGHVRVRQPAARPHGAGQEGDEAGRRLTRFGRCGTGDPAECPHEPGLDDAAPLDAR